MWDLVAEAGAHTHSAARGSGSGSDLAAAAKEEATRHDRFTVPQVLAAVAAERPQARILVTSTGEVYGRAEQLPTTEWS